MKSPQARDPVRLEPGKCGYRGVKRYSDRWRRKRFYAKIKSNYQEFRSSAFAMPHEAAIAYDDLAKKLHGEKAILNFPNGFSSILHDEREASK